MAVLMREAIGGTLRRARTDRRRTLREVSRRARVSLGYLSEVERGRKEPSSELLAAICEALDIELHALLSEAAEAMAVDAALDAALDAPTAATGPDARRPIELRHAELRLAGAAERATTPPPATLTSALPRGHRPMASAAA
jgi:transcriptional regulator with XRE-family HTH domain